MKEIIDLEGTEYLAHTYKFAQVYKKYLKDTGVTDIILRRPQLTGKETEEEKKQKVAEQTRANVAEMMRLLYEEKADATAKLLPLFAILDEGEKMPSTKKLSAMMSRALGDDDFMDFLRSLM